MRFLLSKKSRKHLFTYLKQKHNCSSLRGLSTILHIPFSSLQNWLYEKERYIPNSLIPNAIMNGLEILDKKQDNWGQVKGGKTTYDLILKKYGASEFKKRQSSGGKKSAKLRSSREKPFIIDLFDPLFLEFYGILLGDGWIGKYKYKNRTIWLIGISGHLKLDREFLLYCKKNIQKLLDRKAYLKEKPRYNAIEINFTHKTFLKALAKDLNFPIGKKINLQIDKKIYSLGYEKLKYVIKGIFDTDGSFYLDKTPVGNPYPCISIEMRSKILINQIYEILVSEGFRASYKESKDRCRVTLKGRKQLDKWMKEIGSSNPKHLNKINALVAQQDSAIAS